MFEQVLAFGSGAKTYTEFACGMRIFRDKEKYLNRFYRELALSFQALGEFLSKEVLSGLGNLHEFWGGAYELTVFYDGCFHKFDEILYLVADLRGRNSYQSYDVHPIRLLKVHYEGEHLFIRSLDICDLGENKFAATNDQTTYIPPLLKTSDPPSSVKPRLEKNNLLCFASIYEGPSGSVDSLVFLVPDYERLSPANKAAELPPLPYSIKECSEGVIEIRFAPEFMEMLAQGIYAPRQPNANYVNKGCVGLLWP